MPELSRMEVVIHGASNSIGLHPHPVLESGSIAFPSGKYFVAFNRNGSTTDYQLTHQLEGVPLLTRLIEEGKARYACIVSSPRSAYREVHLSSMPCQTISCNADNLGEPPLFTPAVLCVESSEFILQSDRDGVHEIWDEQQVTLRAGTRLAVGNVIQLKASITQLLSLHVDKDMEKGGFNVDIQTEPFGFRANLHPDLHRFLRFGKSEIHYHLMIHIVTACLARLQKDYSESEETDDISDDGAGWESHRSLKALAELLEAKDLPHWTDESFRPEFVATSLYPLPVPPLDVEDET
ncbi:MAG: hypothetical protein F4008_01055 [Gammaproteobacteria bacterium]|nr:hypothetical protein [Gammaproteobacteria bacterium]MYL12323.1 hypothetical protein [Gammaproteobacteria bacterium]